MVLALVDMAAIGPGLDPVWLIDQLAAGHRTGISSAERTLLTEAAHNHFLLWPAWQFGQAAGVKLVTVFPDNEAAGRGPNIRSLYVLFDGTDGQPLCLITGDDFTRFKTAADSALGARHLARDDARVLTVVGAGNQAPAQIRFMRAARPSLERVLIWNRTLAKAEALAARLSTPELPITATGDLEAAIRQADIVTSVTATPTPLIAGRWLKAGCHLDLVGGYTPEMREADDEAILRARLFADSRMFTLGICGDFVDPMSRGLITEVSVIADLFDLCRGAEGRSGAEDITLFKNGGGGHLDLFFARAVHAAAGGSERMLVTGV